MATKPRNVLQDSRDGLLDMLADTLQNFEKSRPKGNTRRKSRAPDRGEEADFLQDLIQLNVQYLNQVARLGSNYSIVACRALERVYDYFGPSEEELESDRQEAEREEDSPTVVGVADEVRFLRVTLENRRPTVIEFQLGFEVSPKPRKGERDVSPALGFAQNKGAPEIKVTLQPRSSRELRIAVTFNKDMIAGRKYDVTLTLPEVEAKQRDAAKKELGFEQSPRSLSFMREDL